MICDECQALYEEVGDRVRKEAVFAKVRRTDDMLRCKARLVKSEATYFAEVNDAHDTVYVGLATPDRWLSESIEADLLFKGDKIEELLEEELVDRGIEEPPARVEHFRNDARQYVFRSPLPKPANAKLDSEIMIDRVTRTLLAYEAAFRQLGDMTGDEAKP